MTAMDAKRPLATRNLLTRVVDLQISKEEYDRQKEELESEQEASAETPLQVRPGPRSAGAYALAVPVNSPDTPPFHRSVGDFTARAGGGWVSLRCG